MAIHERTVIRRAVRDLLKGKTVAGAQVDTTRIDTWRDSELPALSVYTSEEFVDDEESQDTSPRELKRQVDVEIVGAVGASERMDDAMDALALEIETVMHADPFLGGVAADSILTETEAKVHNEGKRLIGIVVLTYRVTYRTLAPVEAPTLDDFITADARTRIVGITDPIQDGHDTVLVQELP